MTHCPTCQSRVPEQAESCPACGTALPEMDDETVVIPQSRTLARSPSSQTRGARFAPGTILAGRYQIVGELGKGGMGEVYRANDLTLDQPVAIKFLPEGMADNPMMLARFHGEVRMARQVSHPNVSRVHDIGEVDGQLFLTMEYVDGEDLASLLRRIGRLPPDKATEFARSICAGLAAAHSRGVLHRDLKPANIMINSDGHVVIMDFGLAAVADQVHGLEIKSGTPTYMSPEQLAGREVTARSDIFALGLVLYEMYTGKRAYEASSAEQLQALQSDPAAVSIANAVRDADPAIDRVISRCLALDPARRPHSALAVAAALPGGDPLAAALAAGETPSPEMVAASGRTSAMPLAWAVGGAVTIVALAMATLIVGERVRLTNISPLELSPDALSYKARTLAEQFGYKDKPLDTATGFRYDKGLLHTLQRAPKSDQRWDRLGRGTPSGVWFWYRESPRYMRPTASSMGQVEPGDPPMTSSGMVQVKLDPRGALIGFEAVPPQIETAPPAVKEMDWARLFAAAELDRSKFRPAEPQWIPPAMADERAAWLGERPGVPGESLRLEAATWRGRLVYFEEIAPWTLPVRMETPPRPPLQPFLLPLVALLALFAAAALARYNLLRGRGDWKGAWRLAVPVFGAEMVTWTLGAHHVPSSQQLGALLRALSIAVFFAAAIWMAYIALEPYVRRHWPQALVSWTRLLVGKFDDPLVGRDVLLGVTFGVFKTTIWAVTTAVGLRAAGPDSTQPLDALGGMRDLLTSCIMSVTGSLVTMLVTFLVLFFLRLLLRREWIAGVAFTLLFTAVDVAGTSPLSIDLPIALLLWGLTYLVVSRYGFTAYLSSLIVFATGFWLPLTTNFSKWYSNATWVWLVIVFSLAGWALRNALVGRAGPEEELS